MLVKKMQFSYPGVSPEVIIKSFGVMPIQDGTENVFHSVLAEGVDADDIEVSNEAMCYWIATSTRWTHRCHHQNVIKV